MSRLLILSPLTLYAFFIWFPDIVHAGLLYVSGTEVALPLMLVLGLGLALTPDRLALLERHFPVLALPVLAALFFSATIVLSGLTSGNVVGVLRPTTRDLFGAIVLVYAFLVLREPRDHRLVLAAFGLGIVACALFLAAGFVVPPIAEMVVHMQGRFAGTFDHPNQLGIVTSTAIPLVVLARPFRRFVLDDLIVVPALFFIVVVSGSKTNMALGAFNFTLAYLVRFWLEGRIVKLTGFLVVLPVLAAGAVSAALAILESFGTDYVETVLLAFTNPGEVTSVHMRLEIWQGAVDGFSRNFLLGVGPTGTDGYIDFGHAHNLTLDVMLKYGLIGILVYLFWLGTAGGLIWRLLRSDARADRWTRTVGAGVALAMINYLIVNHVSDSGGNLTMKLFYFVWALGLALVVQAPATAAAAPAARTRRLGDRWRGGVGAAGLSGDVPATASSPPLPADGGATRGRFRTSAGFAPGRR